MMLNDLKLGLYFKEAILFAAVQAIGIWTAVQAKGLLREMRIQPQTQSWWIFLAYFALATAMLLIFIRYVRRSGLVLKIFFAFTLFVGMQVVAAFILPGFLSIAVPLALVAVYFFDPFVWLHNLIVVVSVAGIGGILGLNLNPRSVIIILAILALYDYWAVYKTKHMVKMAKSFIRESVIPAIILSSELKGFKRRVREARPQTGFYLLGSGDLVFPLILSSSALSIGLFNAVFVAVFALIGLFITHFIFVLQEKRVPMPALPPLAAMGILGLLLSLIFHR